MAELVQVPSSLDFQYYPEDVQEIIEQYLRRQLSNSEVKDVIVTHLEDGVYVASVWRADTPRSSMVQQTISE